MNLMIGGKRAERVSPLHSRVNQRWPSHTVASFIEIHAISELVFVCLKTPNQLASSLGV